MFTDEELKALEKEEWEHHCALRRAGEVLCEDFKAARGEAARYRVILSFAARQDNPLEAKPDMDKIPCVAEVEAPPFFRVCCEELTKEGLLRFEEREACYDFEKNKHGMAYFFLGLTYKGRMELGRLEREQEEFQTRNRRWCVRIFWISLGALISTLIATVFPRLANKLLNRWFSPEVHQVEVVKLPASSVGAPGK